MTDDELMMRVVEIPVHDLVATTWERGREHVRIAAGTVERALELATQGHRDVCEMSSGELSPLPPGARVVRIPVIDGPAQDGGAFGRALLLPDVPLEAFGRAITTEDP